MTIIGMIGLGNMGLGMCENLVKAGHRVQAFDINIEARHAAASFGAISVTSLEEAVSGAEVIVTMLPEGKHVLGVYFGEDGVCKSMAPDALFIDCSTIDVDQAREAINTGKRLGVDMVDAPVSGGTAAAKAGTLTFMVGGTDRAFSRAKPILECMGKNVFHAGAPGNGQVAKIANNMLLGISMIATSEAFALAEKLGLDAQTFFDISSKASGQCWSMTSYCPAPGPVPAAPSNRNYEPGFAVNMMLKDLKLAASAAIVAGTDTELGDRALKTYQGLSDAGHGNLDFSAVIRKINSEI